MTRQRTIPRKCKYFPSSVFELSRRIEAYFEIRSGRWLRYGSDEIALLL